MPLEKIDLLVLKALSLAPLHGFGIGQRETAEELAFHVDRPER